MSIQLRDGLINQLLDRVLEDLLVRFVVNVPEEDLSSIERVFFQGKRRTGFIWTMYANWILVYLL